MKRFISMLLALLMVLTMFGCANMTRADETAAYSTEPTVSALLADIYLLADHRFEYVGDLSIENIETIIDEIETYMALLEEAKLGLPTEHSDYEQAAIIIDETLNEMTEIVHCYLVDLEELIEEAQWAEKMAEYPVATTVWLYMREHFGWSEVVCAGVMGNIMAEIAGGTLNFDDWDCNVPYGMFQWTKGRRASIKKIYGSKPTVEEQLEFMFDELYGTDGVSQQISNKDREKFLNSSTPEEAAMIFCREFERPRGKGISRKKYARKAYEYFAVENI